jgi:hypothetical protein
MRFKDRVALRKTPAFCFVIFVSQWVAPLGSTSSFGGWRAHEGLLPAHRARGRRSR